MFIISLTYKKELFEVNMYLNKHIEFMNACYEKGLFLVSGRKVPRTGGIIVSLMQDRKEVENLLMNDPFLKNDIADYEIIEFNPTSYKLGLEKFLS